MPSNTRKPGRMPVTDIPDAERLRSLKRMKRLATGLLVLMTVVFAATHFYPGSVPAWLPYLRAFVEAAMVGAIADWFAVTALFRHPMGVPIPHTAIIPRRKDEIGESLARFVENNFLIRQAMLPKLESIDFGGRLAAWLERPENATRLTRDAAGFMSWFVATLDNVAIREFMRENLHMTLREIEITPFIGRILDLLTEGNRHQELIDIGVRVARRQLRENRAIIRYKIESESPWWLPDFVDRELYKRIVLEIENVLDRITLDEDHEARQKFDEGMARLIEKFKNDPATIERGEEIKAEVLDHPAVQNYLSDMWTSLSRHLVEQVGDPEADISMRLKEGIVRLGGALATNEAMQEQVDAWVRDAVLHLVEQYSGEISDVITETVRSWDAEATTERVELQVGRDLQFIRINGTVVGGLAGLLIYTIVHLFT